MNLKKKDRNDRLIALKILIEVFHKNSKLDFLFQKEEASSFTKAICFGVCRYYFRLSHLAESLLNKKPKEMDLWILLLMGLYQLQYLDKPEYASIQETVALADTIKKPWAKGLINAVLRRFCREHETLLHDLEDYNHPSWFISKMKQDWPHSWENILLANDTHPPMILRFNASKTTQAAYLQTLEKNGIKASALPFCSEGILLDSPCELKELPGFAEGEVSIQDGAAQYAVSLLSLDSHLRVLDVCAAPGGKTCHMLEKTKDLKECLALDIDAKRLQALRDNLQRLDLKANVAIGDALDPAAWWDGALFDRILIDAPCSGTGVIRRHPDIKILRTEKDISQLVTLQAELLNKIWPLLGRGGMMLYATCSVLKEENEEQIAHFVNTHSDAALLAITVPWGRDTGFGSQLFPGENNCDGFFYSVLIRK